MGTSVVFDRPRAWLQTVGFASILAAAVVSQSASNLTAALGDTRTLSLYNIHTKETTSILFKRDGRVVAGAYEKLNWALRDWRRNEKTTMDAALFDLLWDIHTELGSKEPIHVISAFRSRGTNEMLRSTSGGQASESRHILGRAIDVHFPDIDVKKLRYSALIRERGGVGYYPTSALPFVHIDTDRVRAWPRLPRMELALLFPSGSTQHLPADGGPITRDDVRTAQAQNRALAVELAAYHGFRSAPKMPIALADSAAVGTRTTPQVMARPLALAQAEPRLVEAPRVIDRPTLLSGPSPADRKKLGELMTLAAALPWPQLVQTPQPARRPQAIQASLGAGPNLASALIAPQPAPNATQPRMAAIDPNGSLSDALRNGLGTTFAAAAAFDDDHPEELSYRPFLIGPLLTLTASPDDPALAQLLHPDVTKTLDMLDQAGSAPPMRLRPSTQVAALLWAQQFNGDAVSAGLHAQDDPGSSPLTSRKVPTTPR